MANEQQAEAYNKRELAKVAKAFSLMGDEAVDEARNAAGALATFALDEIRSAASTRTKGAKAVTRIAQGAKVSKSSKTGRIDLGFASQRFSGGGSTQKLWGGFEFGSSIRPRPDGTIRRLNQFPNYSGKYYASTAPVVKTADFTLADTENWVINDKSGSDIVVTLPTGSAQIGRAVTFQTPRTMVH